MSKLNSNEVLYGGHRETPFLLARIHGEVRFAVQQPSWRRSCFSVVIFYFFACWRFSRIRGLQTEGHFSLTWPPISALSMEKFLMTNASLCFLPAARGPDDRPRGCRVQQRAGRTTCCLTAAWFTLGSCLPQVTTQASACSYSTYMCCRNYVSTWGKKALTYHTKWSHILRRISGNKWKNSRVFVILMHFLFNLECRKSWSISESNHISNYNNESISVTSELLHGKQHVSYS